MASFSIIGSTTSTITIHVVPNSGLYYYRITARPYADTSILSYEGVARISAEYDIVIDGLNPNTLYVVEVEYGSSMSGPWTSVGTKTAETDATTYYVTIVFDANGGIGGPGVVKFSGESSSGNAITLTLPSEVPTRPDDTANKVRYTFEGWATSNTATAATYAPSVTYEGWYASTWENYSVTLYAVWSESAIVTETTCTATLEFYEDYTLSKPVCSPITGQGDFDLSTTKPYVTITLPEGPERGGYTFVNWAFYSDGKTTIYKAGQSYSWYATQAGATYRLYATWSENSSTPTNTAPSFADGVSSTTSVSVCVGETYYVDLSSIFTDADGDALTYSVSKNDAAAVSAPEQYSYVATSAGSVTLKFVANDGEYSSEPYTVILAVTEPDEPDEPETTPGTAWIHTSSGWKRAVVWVYVGQPSKGSWKQAQPWAYNQNTWHKTTT